MELKPKQNQLELQVRLTNSLWGSFITTIYK